MMTAIMNGLMTLEYEQVILTNGGESVLESELMIISAHQLSCELLSYDSCLALTSW
jgi:hypothetical protein